MHNDFRLLPLLDVERVMVWVEPGLTIEQRFFRTGSVSKTTKDGGDLPTIESRLIPLYDFRGPYGREVFLVRLGYYLRTWQVQSQFFRHRLWPIRFEELASLSEQQPQLQFIRPIVQIFETTTGEGYCSYAANTLNGGCGQKSFCTIASGDGWGEDCWFAVASLDGS